MVKLLLARLAPGAMGVGRDWDTGLASLPPSITCAHPWWGLLLCLS